MCNALHIFGNEAMLKAVICWWDFILVVHGLVCRDLGLVSKLLNPLKKLMKHDWTEEKSRNDCQLKCYKPPQQQFGSSTPPQSFCHFTDLLLQMSVLELNGEMCHPCDWQAQQTFGFLCRPASSDCQGEQLISVELSVRLHPSLCFGLDTFQK